MLPGVAVAGSLSAVMTTYCSNPAPQGSNPTATRVSVEGSAQRSCGREMRFVLMSGGPASAGRYAHLDTVTPLAVRPRTSNMSPREPTRAAPAAISAGKLTGTGAPLSTRIDSRLCCTSTRACGSLAALLWNIELAEGGGRGRGGGAMWVSFFFLFFFFFFFFFLVVKGNC
jgi:hypothetical protein